jgi:uncharacterized membrane protein
MLAWLFVLHRKKRDFKKSRLYKSARFLWKRWVGSLNKKPGTTLSIASALIAALWAFSSCRRHWNFGSGAADLGIFTNAIWHWSEGFPYISSVKDGMNLLADHQSYIFLLFGPLYRLLPHPETLLIAQAIALSFGALTLYFLAIAKKVPLMLAALLPLLYWCYLPIRNANAFDFHPEVLLLPLTLGFLWCIETTAKIGKYLAPLFFLLALSTKESAAPVFVGIALSLFAQKRFTGALLIALPALLLFAVNLTIVPKILGAHYAYADVYGGGFFQLLKNIFHFSRLKFLFGTLAPFAFLPLGAPLQFIAALPGYAMLFLTNSDQRLGLGFHYSIEPSTGIFWALTAALSTVWVLKNEKKVFWLLLATMILFFGRSELFSIRRNSPNAHRKWIYTELLPRLSSTDSFASSSAFVSHLANRDWVDALPEIAKPSGEAVNCLLRDGSVNNTPMNDGMWETLAVQTKGYTLEFRCGSLELYHHNTISCLTQEVRCLE